MKSRYDTLDVNVNLNASNVNSLSPKKFNTIDFGEQSQLTSIGQNDQRVNKFRELYFKNEKLRKELKLLNVKLNEKLQKVKLMPSKKRKAMSVDLNVQKPTKALQRQLENAYKQVAMYKKQIVQLKVKQESQSTYQKYKTLENQISFRDIEIGRISEELKSIKNVKKMQDKTLIEEVENDDLKEKLQQYERQFKQGQQKLKDIAKKARKREQQYKKQQAYQVALQKKLRKLNSNQKEQDQDEIVQQGPNQRSQSQQQQINPQDIQLIKQQILKYKAQNETYQKKIELQKKTLRDIKKNKKQSDQKYKQHEIEIKNLNLKIESYRRLIRDHQKKQYETVGYNTMLKNQKLILGMSQKQSSLGKLKSMELESEYPEDSQIQLNLDNSLVPTLNKDQREWKGKPRKITFGFMDSNDSLHKISGIFRGIKVWIDESQLICGLGFFYKENNVDMESGVIGIRTNNELMWQLQPQDKVAFVDGSLTQQGYLSQLMFMSRLGLGTKFGNNAGVDKFNCQIESSEDINGFYCAVRKLGKDTRITELGFWLTKNQ